MIRAILGSLPILIACVATASSGPTGFNVQGLVVDSTNAPVTGAVNFKLQLFDKGANCVLYEEQHLAQDLTTTSGAFSLVFGYGSSKSNKVDGTTVLKANVFRNDANLAPTVACPGGVNFASGDHRLLRVIFNAGSGDVTMTPDLAIQGTPYASVAETLQGKTPSDLLQINSGANLTQTNAESVFTGTNFTKLQALLNGTSTQYLTSAPASAPSFNNQRLTSVAAPTAGTDAANKNYCDANLGGRTVDSTVAALAGGDNGKVLTWDGSKWVAQTATATDGTKLPLGGGTMTGAIDMNGHNVTNAGHITMNTSKYFQIGRYAGDPSGLAAGHEGSLWYDTGSKKVRFWNGSTAADVSSGAGGGGDITGVTASTGLTGGGSSGGVTVSIANGGVDTTQIKDDAVTADKLADSAVANTATLFANPGAARLVGTDGSTGSTLAAVSCTTVGHVLKWTLTGFACAADTDTDTGLTALTGDVTASGSGSQAATVARLQGRTMASDAPNGGDVLTWDAGQSRWEPAAAASGSQWTTAGGAIHYSGDVGIGSTAPGAKLDVNGGVRLAGDAGTCNAAKEGTLRYSSANKRMEFCDGAGSWLAMPYGAASATDPAPNAFSFTDQTNVSLNQKVYSNSLTITGFTGPQVVEVSGPGVPELSISNGLWVTLGQIFPGDTLRIRANAASNLSTSVVTTVTIGTGSDSWSVTTRGGSSVVFRTDATHSSNSINGLLGADQICMNEAAASGWSGTWVALLSSKTVNAKDRVTFEYPIANMCDGSIVESSDLYLGSREGVIKGRSCGTASVGLWTGTNSDGTKRTGLSCSSWSQTDSYLLGTYGTTSAGSTTLYNAEFTCNTATHLLCVKQDNVNWTDPSPDNFGFTTSNGAVAGSTVTSNIVTLTGFVGPLHAEPVAKEATAAEMRVNGGSWVRSASINPGDTVQLRMNLTNAKLTRGYVVSLLAGTTRGNWEINIVEGSKIFSSLQVHYGTGLGGLSGADTICQNEALAAGYTGTWKALLSDETTNAKDRLTLVYPITNACDGSVVEKTDLYQLSLEGQVKSRSCATSSNDVWTGTNTDGTRRTGYTCSSWTAAGGSGAYGNDGALNYTLFYINFRPCATTYQYRLYCVEQ